MIHILYVLAGISTMILVLGIITIIILAIDWLDQYRYGLFNSIVWLLIALGVAYFMGRSIVG